MAMAGKLQVNQLMNLPYLKSIVSVFNTHITSDESLKTNFFCVCFIIYYHCTRVFFYIKIWPLLLYMLPHIDFDVIYSGDRNSGDSKVANNVCSIANNETVSIDCGSPFIVVS